MVFINRDYCNVVAKVIEQKNYTSKEEQHKIRKAEKEIKN